jgi:hypothetical protein
VAHVLRFVSLRRASWWVAATALIAFGFAIDGTSEPGHHAGLILGGIALGISFRRS